MGIEETGAEPAIDVRCECEEDERQERVAALLFVLTQQSAKTLEIKTIRQGSSPNADVVVLPHWNNRLGMWQTHTP